MWIAHQQAQENSSLVCRCACRSSCSLTGQWSSVICCICPCTGKFAVPGTCGTEARAICGRSRRLELVSQLDGRRGEPRYEGILHTPTRATQTQTHRNRKHSACRPPFDPTPALCSKAYLKHPAQPPPNQPTTQPCLWSHLHPHAAGGPTPWR